jgi:CMP-N-acetylneuraminic acid synthetase
MNSILALVPARGGSRRIPGKNIKPLCGLPLIAHTLRTAKAAECFSRILVSTDDADIVDAARANDGETPWLRSTSSAGDTSLMIDVVLEVLDCIEAEGKPLPDALMLLQPTSPFRSVKSIHRAIEMFRESGGESVVSVSQAVSHPYWCKQISQQGELLPFLPDIDGAVRSQDLPPVYALNGLIYLASVATIRQRGSLYSERPRALVIESLEEALDIDTPFDWLVAEALCKQRLEADR